MNLNDKRIAVLLSGGVDSSVVLYELVRQGLQPDCFYIKIGPEEEEEWDCSSEEDLEMATAVSNKYHCKLEVVDCHKEYWNQVTSYFKEIFEFSKQCRFSDCTHTHEPGCAVLKAVEDHYIAQSRYQSYLSMLDDKDENKYREAY